MVFEGLNTTEKEILPYLWYYIKNKQKNTKKTI